MTTERRLGRGLESLLGGARDIGAEAAAAGALSTPIDSVRPNPLQPRLAFNEEELRDLADSVRAVGILQPIIVRRAGQGYEVIAGERRLRAAKLAGLAEVPVIVRDAGNDDMLTLALVENLQREDLNPIEKARAFKELLERYSLTQEDAAKRLGKDRSTIANFIRLLELPPIVQHVVSRGTISMGHARALLGLEDGTAQQTIALRVEEEGLSVREVERLVASAKDGKSSHKRRTARPKTALLRDIEDRLRERFGTKVTLEHNRGKGRLTIHFFTDDDLQRVLELLGISSD